ncbi:DUF3618 domain-containing protein [Noviherbaspirillum sp.]|uniref:DUF3618 domain-containing protein n=1 Tax=Noviherbaspirillum sp. TaxID=1926288 RepID=UPI002FE177A3
MRENNEDTRRPEEIENDIERTRAEVSSTIDAIQNKLAPTQVMDRAVHYARTNLPDNFGTFLGDTVRKNPIPIILFGLSIASIMVQGRKSDGVARVRRQARDRQDLEFDPTVYDVDYVSSTAAVGSPEGRTSGTMDKVGEKGRGLMNKVSELGHRVSDSTSSMASRARSKLSGSTGSGTGVSSGQLTQKSRQQYYRAKDGFDRMIDEQPLMLGILGVAIGTLLGASLPNTRREDQLMGTKRDQLLDTVKETVRTKADSLKDSAQRVAQAAQREVKSVASEASRNRTTGSTTPTTGTRTTTVVSDTTIISTTPGQQNLH